MQNNPSKSRPYSDKPPQRRPFSAARPIHHQSQIPPMIQINSILPNLPEKEKDLPNLKSDPIKSLTEIHTHQIFEAPVTYRIAHPGKSTYLVSLEFWKENNQNNKSLTNWYKRPQTSKDRPLIRGLSLQKNEDLLEKDAKNANSLAVFQKLNYENEKPFSFLASLGGKKTSFTQLTSPTNEENINMGKTFHEESIEEVARNIQVFSKLDMDKSLKSQIKRQQSGKQQRLVSSANIIQISNQFRVSSAAIKDQRLQSAATGIKPSEKTEKPPKQRPITAIREKPQFINKSLSARNRVLSGKTGLLGNMKSETRKQILQNQIIEKNQDFFEEELDIREDFAENDDFYEKAEAVQALNFKNRPKSNLLTSRPISGKSAAPGQFFNTFTKYAKFNDVELPYEDLFDRNERTIAATYAKFGDLGYYSPVQRIGVYMQFSAKLKRDHLIEIINLQKTSNF